MDIEKIREKLNGVTLDKDDFDMLVKDRLDFGFDSIYFRYAELCDELAAYYALYNHTDPIKERKQLTYRKKHFYDALEQLVHAHDEVK